VTRGNHKGIKGLRDLAKPGLRLGLTDENYSTLGHIAPHMFDKAGKRKEIEANVVTRTRMGGEVANAVAIGNLDATIVWNAVIHLRRGKLDAVPIEPEFLLQPGVDAVTTATFGVVDMGCIKVTIATLKCSKRLEAARAFAEYVASPQARDVFAAFGFSPAPPGSRRQAEAAGAPTKSSQAKAAAPGATLHLYCGAGIRPPVAEAVEAFEKQAGIAVRCDFAGSGTLLSNIRAAKRGDLYMPGDSGYVDLAEKLGIIASRHDVCYWAPVILVPKGNPKGIRSLQDLVKPGVRLGVGNPDACAIGKIAVKLFEKNNIALDALKANTKVETLTVNELGIQVKIGQLDAAIVWDPVAAYYPDSTEAIAIPREKNIVSAVTIGVLKFSSNPGAAKRFVDFLLSDAGRAIFARHHYTTTPPAE